MTDPLPPTTPPDIIWHSQSATDQPKRPPFKRVVVFIIVVAMIAALASTGWFNKDKLETFLHKFTSESTETKKDAKNSDSFSNVIITIKINPTGPVIFLKSTPSNIHLAPPLLNKPDVSPTDNYIFAVEEIDQAQNTLYYTWNAYPIDKKPDGSFEVLFAVPYQKKAVVKVKENGGKVILYTTLK